MLRTSSKTKAQVRQIDALGQPLAGGEVALLALNPKHVVTGACKVDGVSTLQAAQVGDPSGGRAEEAQVRR